MYLYSDIFIYKYIKKCEHIHKVYIYGEIYI